MTPQLHIFLATPCYDNSIKIPYYQSVERLKRTCIQNKINLTIMMLGTESLITRGRNTCVAEFLANPIFTHLLFIDSDIGFDSNNIMRLIKSDYPLTGICCPKKKYNWDKMFDIVKESSEDSPLTRSLQYAVNMPESERDPKLFDIRIKNDFIKLKHIGTGCMLIKREVFDALIKKNPELNYKDTMGNETPENKDCFWAFYNTPIDPVTRHFLSEDYYFCQLWTSIGGEIWGDISGKISHMGSHTYNGCLKDMFYSEKGNQRKSADIIKGFSQ